MSDRIACSLDTENLSPRLAEVAEEITRRLQGGERIRAEDYVARYPNMEDPIRRLIPTLLDLALSGCGRAGLRVAPRVSPPAREFFE